MKKIRLVLICILALFCIILTSCSDDENVYTKDDVNSLIAELETVLTEKASENETALNTLKSEYAAKIAELEKEIDDSKAVIESLTSAYNAKVAELEASDKTNADALAKLKTDYEADLAELQAADSENEAAIKSLTSAYNAKVSELEASDKANADALAVLTAEYNQAIAGIESEIADNTEAINTCKSELQGKIDTLTAKYDAKVESIEGLIAALRLTDTENSARIAELESQINQLLNAKTYTVTFNSNGGTAVESITVEENKKIPRPENPTRAGYDFDGWYTGYNYEEKWVFTGFTVTEDITLTAKWKPIYCVSGNVITGLTEYGKYLTELNIPAEIDGVEITSIGGADFLDCRNLTSIIIENGVTNIGTYAFSGCARLTSVEIPDSVTNIGNYAFSGCERLVYNEYDNAYYLGNSNNQYLLLVKTKNTSITSCTVHNDTKFIQNSAFEGCTGLTSVIIPDSVTSIGSSAFYGCTSLTSVTIPDSVTYIGSYAFAGCTNLVGNEYDNAYYLGNDNNPYLLLVKEKDTSITSCIIHSDTKFIQNVAFANCESLVYNEYDNAYYLGNDNNPYLVLVKVKDEYITSCIIHSDTKFILGAVFYNCYSLKSIIINEDNCYYKSVDGNLYSKDGTILIRYASGKSNTAFNVPDGVTTIYAFAFRGCTSLASIAIPDSVTSIGGSAFRDCTSLASITIPGSVTSISASAFRECTGLISVYYGGTQNAWNNITIGNFNTDLTDTTRYYYSETVPTEEGNYWYYDENGEITIW